MKNTFGSSITLTIFGESHGPYIGAVLDGLAPGMEINEEYIKAKLAKRRPSGKISTKRVETDEFLIVSGAFEGRTTGTPLTLLIPNTSTKSADYSSLSKTPRPGHADYTAMCKYHGFQDPRGGGHFSGRITAALVAAGAILSFALSKKGIKFGTHIKKLGGAYDREFDKTEKDVDALENLNFPVLDALAAEKMMSAAEAAAECGDSIGGVLESVVIGVPAGVGEPWFDSVEGVLSHILFSIPAVKGVEFGRGFGFADMYGSEANDAFVTDGERIYTKTNNNGGINGGITNGMPIVFRTAIKPTPSIYKKQETVDLETKTAAELVIEGRHDPAIIHRAAAVVDAAAAIAVADLLATRYGTDFLADN